MKRFISRLIAGSLALLGFAFLSPVSDAAAQSLPQSREQIQLSFSPVVKRATPAVVNIYASRKVQQTASPLLADPFFRQFFGNMLPNMPPRVENSLGSGVLVKSDGLIVTNFHVIKGAQEIKVVLSDRREFDGRIVRADEHVDLAVIKIDAPMPLPFLEIRDFDTLEVGDLVLAIGNPFGVGQTVTSGIVSALARTNAGANDYRYFIQTDAAINPGNSGGALITLDGKLVGINTLIFSQSGGSVGIGFAIPSDMVRTVVDVGSTNRIVRSWLGANGQAVTSDLAQSLKLDRPIGVIVNDVYPDSPADRAGLKIGDVILSANDREIDDPEGLRFRVATQPVGSTLTLMVQRSGRMIPVPVTLVAPPESPPRDVTTLSGNQPLAGAEVGNLSPAFAEELGTQITRGVVVTGVKPGSPAGNLGIRPGDLISRIDRTEVRDVRQLASVMAQPARNWRVEIKRDGKVLSVDVSG